MVFFQALFPFDDWWVVPLKVIFDQTAWSAIWNSIYYTLLGFLRFESPATVFTELRATFLPMLTVSTLSCCSNLLHVLNYFNLEVCKFGFKTSMMIECGIGPYRSLKKLFDLTLFYCN